MYYFPAFVLLSFQQDLIFQHQFGNHLNFKRNEAIRHQMLDAEPPKTTLRNVNNKLIPNASSTMRIPPLHVI